eukprot:TRINITY_DN5029_c0_g2_i3.p1 TRINITY_DN5029_c0_g2~~TRINITY_DN5029_c0_g2_i3.p1  ORF type:complete len:371 (+),score=48.74 TRINITY_DN5029_c0_g2_i3:1382-2494(+)
MEVKKIVRIRFFHIWSFFSGTSSFAEYIPLLKMLCMRGTSKEVQKSQQIDRRIKEERHTTLHKLLLLGCGDSGKSTFLKQMKVLHKNGFSTTETRNFVSILRENCLQVMRILVETLSDDNKQKKEILEAMELTPSLAKVVSDLWNNNKKIKKYYEHRSEHKLSLPTTTTYFMENVERIAGEDFVPTHEDILRARSKTTGISELEFSFRNAKFSIVDVGGQRSERRKWIHCFSDVTAVIFLFATNEYDMFLEEDPNQPRMEEAFQLFQKISETDQLSDKTWIVFLNKTDIFRQKLLDVPFNKTFKDIPDSEAQSYSHCIRYIEKKMKGCFKGRLPPIFHQTNSLETNTISKIFDSVVESIFKASMMESGLT